jgi:hypothetical protein
MNSPQTQYEAAKISKRIKTFYDLAHGLSGNGAPWQVGPRFQTEAVRNMVSAGIPERVAVRMSGHKTRAILARFHLVTDGDLKEAAQRLDCALTP